MRSLLRLILCLVCFLIFLTAAACVRLYFFLLRREHWKATAVLNRSLAVCLARMIGVRISLSGPRPHAGPAGFFLVSNHLGYLDGFVLGSLFPLVYTSKSELKRWPLIGAMTSLSGTLFIKRGRKNHLADDIRRLERILRQGANVLFFPEGTSTNGDRLLGFRSAFFEAPARAQSPVVPVTLRYLSLDAEPVSAGNRDCLYWYAEMTFAGHFFRLLSHRNISVEVVFHPAVRCEDFPHSGLLRKELSGAAQKAVASGLS